MGKLSILMLVFNRPDETRTVLEAVRAYRPERLYVAADGPRPGNPEDRTATEQVRALFRQRIDWPCQVKMLFQEKNLGCRFAPPKGIDWFFEQEEEGAVLEDDCLPAPDFFRFCEEMLKKYRDNPEIMHIGGACFYPGSRRMTGSYYFSRYPHIWGWATWRRAWKFYDVEMKSFPDYLRSRKIEERIRGAYPRWRILQQMKATCDHSPYFNTWDWQWTYTLFRENALAIVPTRNLVSNIGFSGTHSVDATLCALRRESLPQQLLPPPREAPDPEADDWTFRHFYRGSWKDRIRFLFYRLRYGRKGFPS